MFKQFESKSKSVFARKGLRASAAIAASAMAALTLSATLTMATGSLQTSGPIEVQATHAMAAKSKDASTSTEKDHKKLRKEAEAAGETVFEGTLHIYNGTDAVELLGTTQALTANGDKFAEAEKKSEYAILTLDKEQTVSLPDHPDGPTKVDTSYICLGDHIYNAYKETYGDDGVKQWKDYDGQKVCAATSDLWVSTGVSVINVPTSKQSRLLYAEKTADKSSSSSSTSSSTSSTSSSSTSSTAKDTSDPTWYESTDTTFTTADFIVTVPDEWAGDWRMVEVEKVGNNSYAWTFEYTGDAIDYGMGYHGVGGKIVVADRNDTAVTDDVKLKTKATAGSNSNDRVIWYAEGDPTGFFTNDGANGSTPGRATIEAR